MKIVKLLKSAVNNNEAYKFNLISYLYFANEERNFSNL